ncbi:MAG: protein-arginine deiminase [Deltaproteobacteria bacterium]|nr:protein-arginine deiminase [Deltaproteobacteria bacterium]
MSRRAVGAWWLPLATALVFGGCGNPQSTNQPGADAGQVVHDAAPVRPDAKIPPDPNQPVVDIRADVNRDGVVKLDDPADDKDEETWDGKHGAIFLANLDDDTSRCTYSRSTPDDELAACHDAADEEVNGPDDLADLATIKVAPWPKAPAQATGKLVISDAASSRVRLFRATGGGSYALFNPAQEKLSQADLRQGLELRIEAKDIVRDASVWDGFVDVTLEVESPAAGAGKAPLKGSDTVRLRVAPVITFHHLTEPVTTYVTSVPGDPESAAFTKDLAGLLAGVGLGPAHVEIRVSDLWTQDFFETGYMSMPKAGGEQHVVRVALRSANVEMTMTGKRYLRSAGRVVFEMRTKDVAAIQQVDESTPEDMQSLNSTGNLEVVPPYAMDGASYPMGRRIQGSIPTFHIDRSFDTMLTSQKVQPAIYLDTSWLLVGHVDETLSYVKKAGSPRGWVLIVNDPAMAVKMLQDLKTKGQGGAKLFTGRYWIDERTYQQVPAEVSVDQVLNDTEVMSETTKAIAEVDAQLAILKKETGLTEDEIVRLPFLHYPVAALSVAYQPGTVNLFYVKDGTVIAPETHGPVVDGTDVFKDQMEKALAAHGVAVKWLENWDLYHRNMGEVHCATNTARAIPSAKWWESGR